MSFVYSMFLCHSQKDQNRTVNAVPDRLHYRNRLVSEKHRAKLDRTAAKLGLEVLPGR